VADAVLSKRQMYRDIVAGRYGNTTPQWMDVDSWRSHRDFSRYQVWGVRTLTPGGPCRLFCPREEVQATAEEYQRQGHRVNISIMLDAVVGVTLMCDVFDSDTGLRVYGVEYPGKKANWRDVMPRLGRQHDGIDAAMLLRRHLNPCSYADLEALRERYPGHVYELSACDRCIGTAPGRNAIVWEVRVATGEYERSAWGNY
jgi:hypothetical protein